LIPLFRFGILFSSHVEVVEGAMSLQFVGEAGIYLPDRDAVKIVAIAGDSVIDCYVTQSALKAIGCDSKEPREILRCFEARRIDCEIAALVKFRRATRKLMSLEITAADLAVIEGSHAA
jgi:hypothetical protein